MDFTLCYVFSLSSVRFSPCFVFHGTYVSYLYWLAAFVCRFTLARQKQQVIRLIQRNRRKQCLSAPACVI